jgi:AraC-like DNA-binding protein
MLVYALVLLNLLGQDVGFFAEYPKLWLLLSGLPLLSGPLHYLYALHLIHPERRFRRGDWVHILPYLLYKLTELSLLFGEADTLAFILRDVTATGMPWRFFLFNWAIIVQSMLYLGGTLFILHRHRRGLEDVVSSAHYLRLTWLRNITLLSLGAWLLFTTEYALYLDGMLLADRFGITGILGGILIYVMGYMGLARSEILETPGVASSMQDVSRFRRELDGHLAGRNRPVPEISELETGQERSGEHTAGAALSPQQPMGIPPASPSYSRSGLSPQRAAEIERRLRSALEEEHVYRDSGLTLPKLAETLEVAPHNLSEVINTRYGMNFFDLVNGYRVREVQQRLEDAAHRQFTILAIALDSGFNSKTSFNTVFKKHTGLTPSEYRSAKTDRTNETHEREDGSMGRE